MWTVIGLIGSGVVGALLMYYFSVLQRSRKELGYQILSANVIIPQLPKKTPGIQVMVKSSLLSGHAEGMQEYRPVERVLGFRVRVRNTGNQVLENQAVTFTLDENARIISIEPEQMPDLGGRIIECSPQHPTPNAASAEIPFPNQGQEVIFSLQSVDNAGTACSVSAGAPGLRYFDIWERAWWFSVWRMLAIGLVLAVPSGIVELLDISGIVSVKIDVISQYLALSLLVGGMALVAVLVVLVGWFFDRSLPKRPRRTR